MTAFAALFFAHVLADYVLQSKGMVARKREAKMLLLHTAIVIATAQLALGRVDTWIPLAVGGVHLCVDIVKSRLAPSLLSYLVDQAAHIATIAVAAWYAPDVFADGPWPAEAATVMAIIAGFIFATRAGGFAVALLMGRFDGADLPESLPAGGFWIGMLERAIIFLFILVGEPMGIGFLIAAKSVLRYDTVSGDSRAAEYVIIGTLASFGWAMAVAWATLELMAALPPLGFSPLYP
jgi:hypothetical protein